MNLNIAVYGLQIAEDFLKIGKVTSEVAKGFLIFAKRISKVAKQILKVTKAFLIVAKVILKVTKGFLISTKRILEVAKRVLVVGGRFLITDLTDMTCNAFEKKLFFVVGASAPNPDLLFVLPQKVSKKVKPSPASLEKLALSWLKPSKLAPSSLKQDSFKRQLHLFFGSPDEVTR